jgi:hypothetical protein
VDDKTPPISLGYDAGQARAASPGLYRLCLLCGIGPLIAGLGILALYWLTDLSVLPILGLLTLLVGGTMVFAGFVMNVIYLSQARRATIDRAASIRRGSISLLILAMNIPAAIFCVIAGVSFSTRVQFVVENQGTSTIDGGTLLHSNQTGIFGKIAPGTTASAYLRIDNSGPIYIEFRRNGTQMKNQIYGHADSDSFSGDRAMKIIVNDEGAQEISD